MTMAYNLVFQLVLLWVGAYAMSIPHRKVERKVTQQDCGTGDVAFGYSCYAFYHRGHLYWDEAKSMCQQQGAHLLSIETENEFNFVKNQIGKELKDLTPLSVEQWWTSGKRERENNRWTSRWIWKDESDGGQGQIMEYAPWFPGEPNNVGRREYYVSLLYKSSTLGLNDARHDSGLGFICEYEQPCPDGWVAHGASCYNFVLDAHHSWHEALANCGRQGAHLVSLQSISELRWLEQRLNREIRGRGEWLEEELFWTSGHKDVLSRDWFWDEGEGTEGETFSLPAEVWYKGEPDKANQVEIYMSLYYNNRAWGIADSPGNYQLRSVCEMSRL